MEAWWARQDPSRVLPERLEQLDGFIGIRSLGDTIHEMRMAGLGPDTVDSKAFIMRKKGKELLELLNAYERFLKENRLIDHAGLLDLVAEKRAAGKAQKAPFREPGEKTVSGRQIVFLIPFFIPPAHSINPNRRGSDFLGALP